MIAGILRRQKTVSAPKTPEMLKKKKDDNAKSLSMTMKPDHDDDGMKPKFIDNEFDEFRNGFIAKLASWQHPVTNNINKNDEEAFLMVLPKWVAKSMFPVIKDLAESLLDPEEVAPLTSSSRIQSGTNPEPVTCKPPNRKPPVTSSCKPPNHNKPPGPQAGVKKKLSMKACKVKGGQLIMKKQCKRCKDWTERFPPRCKVCSVCIPNYTDRGHKKKEPGPAKKRRRWRRGSLNKVAL